jgi:hypothetical protein
LKCFDCPRSDVFEVANRRSDDEKRAHQAKLSVDRKAPTTKIICFGALTKSELCASDAKCKCNELTPIRVSSDVAAVLRCSPASILNFHNSSNIPIEQKRPGQKPGRPHFCAGNSSRRNKSLTCRIVESRMIPWPGAKRGTDRAPIDSTFLSNHGTQRRGRNGEGRIRRWP